MQGLNETTWARCSVGSPVATWGPPAANLADTVLLLLMSGVPPPPLLVPSGVNPVQLGASSPGQLTDTCVTLIAQRKGHMGRDMLGQHGCVTSPCFELELLGSSSTMCHGHWLCQPFLCTSPHELFDHCQVGAGRGSSHTAPPPPPQAEMQPEQVSDRVLTEGEGWFS